MRLGIHYHNNFKIKEDHIFVPGYIGIFFDSLAKEFEEVHLFLSESTSESSSLEDYQINQKNVFIHSLGKAKSFPSRIIFPSSQVKKFKEGIPKIDVFLVRMPTPLAPYFLGVLKKLKIPTVALLIGDYVEGLKSLNQPLYRLIPIILLTHFYQFLQRRSLIGVKILTNSDKLRRKFHDTAKSVKICKTTSLQDKDIWDSPDSKHKSNFNQLLFVGRINFQKGLRELIEAVSELNRSFPGRFSLDIVGWDDDPEGKTMSYLKNKAKKMGVSKTISFHGKVELGEKLFSFYKKADIFILPTYHEGFPRTIWEAMAHGVPVITTKVGGIPFHLLDGKNAILIEPEKPDQIVSAIEKLTSSKSLYNSIVLEGYNSVKDATLESQSKIISDMYEKI